MVAGALAGGGGAVALAWDLHAVGTGMLGPAEGFFGGLGNKFRGVTCQGS